MTLLDTDTVTLLFQGHERVERRARSFESAVASTIITWIEVLQGRFDAILKAADAEQLERAQRRLEDSLRRLESLKIVPIDAAAAQQFEKLLGNKKLKKIGRGDILIASIALAHKAKLATRNLRHFKLVPGLTSENWAD